MRRRRVGLCACLALTACGLDPTGYSAPYAPSKRPDFPIVVPPGAPSIAAQFQSAPPGSGGHFGADFIAPRGTPVLAAAPGRVVASYHEPVYGQQIVIDHGTDGSGIRHATRYLHLARRDVEKGDVVVRGQPIAALGGTGFAGGGIPHLHFELYVSDWRRTRNARDPNLYWIGGPGQVTCPRPAMSEPARFAITHPVRCGEAGARKGKGRP